MSRLKIKMSIDTNLVIVIVKENYLTMKRNISNLIMCQHLYDYVNNRKKFQKERVQARSVRENGGRGGGLCMYMHGVKTLISNNRPLPGYLTVGNLDP